MSENGQGQSHEKKKSGQAGHLFGIFFLDEALYAIELMGLQEIITPPENVQSAPHCPYFMEGLFNLRGRAIPLIHTKSLLSQKSVPFQPDAGVVVILKEGDARIGARFDGTQSVLRVQETEISKFEYSGEESPLPVRGVIKPKDSDQFIPILDIQRVLKFTNLPTLEASAQVIQTHLDSAEQKDLRHLLCFSLDSVLLGLETQFVSEIISVHQFEKNVLTDEFYLGSLSLRGQCLPVLSLAHLLNSKDVKEHLNFLMIIEFNDLLFALKVDEFKTLKKVDFEKVQEMPLLSSFSGEFVLGVEVSQDESEIIILKGESLFESEKIQKTLKGHQNLFGNIQKRKKHQGKDRRKDSRSSFMVFQMKQRFAIPMLHIAEVLDGKQEIHPSIHVPPAVLGFLNLRGEAVPVLEPYEVYGLGTAPEMLQSKILLFASSQGKFGIRVDQIETILSLDVQSEIPLPEILFQETQKRYAEELGGGVVTKKSDGTNEGLLLLKPEDFIEKLRLVAEDYQKALKSAA